VRISAFILPLPACARWHRNAAARLHSVFICYSVVVLALMRHMLYRAAAWRFCRYGSGSGFKGISACVAVAAAKTVSAVLRQRFHTLWFISDGINGERLVKTRIWRVGRRRYERRHCAYWRVAHYAATRMFSLLFSNAVFSMCGSYSFLFCFTLLYVMLPLLVCSGRFEKRPY
jgi:hypothetical protein